MIFVKILYSKKGFTMNNKLSEYISLHKNKDREVHYTHVSCVRPQGRYGFNRESLEGFWNLYCDLLEKNPEMVSGIAEMPQEYSMLVVDGDIKKKISDLLPEHPEIKGEVREGSKIVTKYNPIRLYNDKHIISVIRSYQEVIQSVTRDWEPKHSICVLLEKDPYKTNDDEYIKSGFHLAFINYFCNKSLQDTYLIPRVVDKVNELEIFKDLGYPMSSSVLDISKKHSSPKPWLLYKSRKSESSGTYTATRAFDSEGNEISLEKAFEGYRIFNEFEEEIKYNGYSELVKLLPRVFSVNPCHRQTVDIFPIFDASANISFNEEKAGRDEVKYDQTYEQQMETAEKLLEMIDAFRADDYDKWMEIGWIIFNISDGSERGLELWSTFSSQSPKFSQEICIRQWSQMYKGNKTLGSLKYYAKIDDPEAYEEFRCERLKKMVLKAVDGSHNDLARALYESYSTDFVCASLNPEMWFYYTNHHWEPMEEGIELRKKISSDLVKKYSEMIREHYSELQNVDDEDVGGKNEKKTQIAPLTKLIFNLKNSSFKNSIMKECREVFYDRDFLKVLGKGKYLLALQNGVYDLQNHVFRDGTPEDYIAFQMPIAYREFNQLDQWVIETQNFFEKIFPDTSIREYFLDRCAEMLVGGNKRKHVYFWTGRGNNGKSVMKSLIQKMFGEYFIDIPNSVLVGQKPKSGQACPELARADRGVRAAFTQEPNKKDLVNTGALKEYSGNDTFYARTLFEKGGEIEPMFKLVMICLTGDARVSLPCGISLPLEKMREYSFDVLTWCSDLKTIIKGVQTNWMYQGEKKCVELTLSDSRKIRCTPDHRFLTSSGDWIEAQDIVLNETSLKMTIDNPLCDDFFTPTDYIFDMGRNFQLDMKNTFERLKAMAFCRILGYQLTDTKLENMQDINCLLEDIKLFSPHGLTHFYDFVYDEKCPTYLIREFFGAFFGGNASIIDGTLSVPSDRLSQFLREVLEQRFGISTVENSQGMVIISDIFKFSEKIGMRYNISKSLQLRGIKIDFSAKLNSFADTFELSVVSREDCGTLPVYDLTVNKTHNFIANGIITHNCNDLPGVTTNDPAVWNRLRVIPFESTFTDNPPEDEDVQFRTKTFLKDENFDEKLPHMLEPLFWILVKRLPKIKTVIYEPSRVKEATEKYRRSQDIYAQFIDEKLVEDKSKFINIMDFFQSFREWHKQAFPGVVIPSRNDCNEYLIDVWGSPKNYKWSGYRLRTERDDIQDGRVDENETVDYSNFNSNPLLQK